MPTMPAVETPTMPSADEAAAEIRPRPTEPRTDVRRQEVGGSGRGGSRAPSRSRTKSDKMDWYILKVQSNREDSIREGLLRRVAIAGLEQLLRRRDRADREGHGVQGRQEAGRQAEALSGLPRRPHGDQRRHVVPGPRDAGHRRFHRRGRHSRRPMLPHEVARIVARQEEKSRRGAEAEDQLQRRATG